MVKLGSAIKNQVAMGQNENDIMKRNDEYALNAFITKDNKKNMRQAPTKIKYAKNSLLDKIISSNLNENAINKRLEEISYAAINGQRQTEGTYKPEGVQMLGQLGREKPLEAITKEMIQQYQEDEQAKPYMVDGEARQYLGATYEPQFEKPFENMRTVDEIDDIITRYTQARTDITSDIEKNEWDIKETIQQIASITDNINTEGYNLGKLYTLQKEKNRLERLKKERKELDKQISSYDYDLKNLDDNKKEVIKYNSVLKQKNREEVLKYEQSLKDANKNRLNLQQQPYESEFDYYQRLKEVEKQKFDPVLYKKYAENEATKKLKPNLDELFSDTSFKENVIKNINAEDKFMINRLFDKVGKAYLDEYGYNNTRLSPKMTAEALKRILNTVKGQEISPLQAALQRNRQREIYSDTIALARDRQDLEAQQAAQQTAATQLQARMRQRPQREIYSDTIALARDRQDLEARQAAATQLQARMRQRPQREIYSDTIALARDRQDLEARQAAAAAEQAAAATNIQRIFRGNEGRINAALTRNQNRINARNTARQAAAAAEQAAAATNIQRIFRGNEGRINAALTRNQNRINARNTARQAAAAEQAAAATNIQRIFRGNEGRINARNTARQVAAAEQAREENRTAVRESQQQRMDDIRLQKEREYLDAQDMAVIQKEVQKGMKRTIASRNIQRIFRGNEGRKKALQIQMEQQAAAETAALEKRKQNTEKIKEMIRGSRYKTDVPINQEQLNKLVNYHIQNKLDAKAKKLYSKADDIEKDLMRESIKNLYIKALVPLSATDVITKSLKTTKAKNELMDVVRKAIKERQKEPLIFSQSPEVSPGAALTALSGATTIGEQMRAGLRKPRSDLGGERGPSKKTLKKEQQRQSDTAFYETLTPDELNYFNSKKRIGGKNFTTILNEIRKQREGPKGSGFRKPPKRQVKVNPEEKKKNRLQLVIAQIKAGNTNPKLILEVNKLYKSLYDIDNAFMMLK